MSERTIGEIVEAAKGNEPATELELRLALCAVSSLLTLHSGAPLDKRQLWYHERMETERFESRFRLMRQTPSTYLGPHNTPGNPEYDARRSVSQKILAKALDVAEQKRNSTK